MTKQDLDKTLKESYHNKTIGLIVSRRNDEYIIEFSTDNIISTTYELIKN